MAEQLLGKREKANIVLIEGNPGTAPQRMRSQGFKEVVAKHRPGGRSSTARRFPGGPRKEPWRPWKHSSRPARRSTWRAAGGTRPHPPPPRAILEKKLPQKVYVTGLEFAKELIPYIRDGKVSLTANYHHIRRPGTKAVEAAFKHLKGQTLPAMMAVDLVIVGKEPSRLHGARDVAS
ncbi:MAG: hypothetical protein M0C28_23560 [Candidatus Moduliflexus flocculans]|nr:hypothetical protein [Candidatus Moduliflexus flocculans]